MSVGGSGSCIVLDHDQGRLVRAWRWVEAGEPSPWDGAGSVGTDLRAFLPELARREPTSWIGWRRLPSGPGRPDGHDRAEPPRFAPPDLESICRHAGLTDAERAAVAHLGYIEQMEAIWSPNAARRGDWLVAADAGWLHASALRRIGWWRRAPDFRVALLDFGRRASRSGMLCLVDPRLAADRPADGTPRVGSVAGLIRRCHGVKWLLFWAFCRTLYGPGRLTLWGQVARALAVESPPRLTDPEPRSAGPRSAAPDAGRVSVVVPTLGRPRSVAALLRDLAEQTVPVHEVVVVAQDTGGDAATEPRVEAPYALHWLRVDWTGSCRARNLAMSRTSGEWLLLLDDDVRCPPDFVETLIAERTHWGLDAASVRVRTPAAPVDEAEKFGERFPASHRTEDPGRGADWMWPGFAGGASLVRAELARRVDGFDERLDLGYGEDFEFGLRLREAGALFLQLQRPYVVHYHEPVGGFRAPAQQPWRHEEEPKPSPYILRSRSTLPRPCRRGYAWTYLLGAMRSARWPWRAAGVVRRWRSARRWADRLGEGRFGGIRAWRERRDEMGPRLSPAVSREDGR